MLELSDLARLMAAEQGLAVVATARADGSIQSSLVNAGVLDHPVTGDRCVGFVTYGRAKLRNLRARPWATVTVRSGWQWGTAEGRAGIAGPDDPLDGVDAERVPGLLRDIFTAAGGAHDDWAEFDRTMARQRRAAVFVIPGRVYGN